MYPPPLRPHKPTTILVKTSIKPYIRKKKLVTCASNRRITSSSVSGWPDRGAPVCALPPSTPLTAVGGETFSPVSSLASWCFETAPGAFLVGLPLLPPVLRVALAQEVEEEEDAPVVGCCPPASGEEATARLLLFLLLRCCLTFSSCSCAILDLSRTSLESTTGVAVLFVLWMAEFGC